MVRHCGRPPARPPAPPARGRRCRAPLPRPPCAPRRPGRPEPRPAASVPLSGGALLPAFPFFLRPFPPGRRRYVRAEEAGGAGPSREPRGVWGAGNGLWYPSPGSGTGVRGALERGEGMGQRPCSCPVPSPAPLCLAGDWGPGFRVMSSPPPRRGAGASPSARPGRSKDFPGAPLLPVLPAPTPLKSPGSFPWGGVSVFFLSPSPFDASHAFGE